jgi:hypothetical protein
MATRPAIFKWRQTEPPLIVCAVCWYRRYSLSLPFLVWVASFAELWVAMQMEDAGSNEIA